MSALAADVQVLVVTDEYEICHVAVSWDVTGIERRLIQWAKKEFTLDLPEEHGRAREEVYRVLRNNSRRYQYEIYKSRIQDV
jgi:hypothetical protein